MEPTCSYFELLDKENGLSFDLSLLDCIPLNEDDNLDSVEATIGFQQLALSSGERLLRKIRNRH